MSKIGKVEWIILYLVMAFIDAIQVILDFFVVGAVINTVADPIIGGLLLTYFEVRGVSIIKRPARLISLLGGFGLEIFTGGIAPAWVVDIWLIHKSSKKEESDMAGMAMELLGAANIRNPLNKSGVRMPRNSTTNTATNAKPKNVDGIRPPKLNT